MFIVFCHLSHGEKEDLKKEKLVIRQGGVEFTFTVPLELYGWEKFVINIRGTVKVIKAIAVPSISIVICRGVIFFLEGSPASIK